MALSRTAGPSGEWLAKNYNSTDIAPNTMFQIIQDALDFIEKHADDLTDRMRQSGKEFWHARAGERDAFQSPAWWPDPETRKKLVQSARSYGPLNLYVGDDEKLHATVAPPSSMSGRKDWDPRAEAQPWDVRDFEMFFNSYIETALWSSTDEEGTPLDDFANASDIEPETRRRMGADAQNFLLRNWDDIKDDLIKAGHDFWLTRNGHGAGFWDGDWPEAPGKRLTKASKEYGSFTLYVGDDGRIDGMAG